MERIVCSSCGVMLAPGDEGWVVVVGFRRAANRGSGSNLLSRIKIGNDRFCRSCVISSPGQLSFDEMIEAAG